MKRATAKMLYEKAEAMRKEALILDAQITAALVKDFENSMEILPFIKMGTLEARVRWVHGNSMRHDGGLCELDGVNIGDWRYREPPQLYIDGWKQYIELIDKLKKDKLNYEFKYHLNVSYDISIRKLRNFVREDI